MPADLPVTLTITRSELALGDLTVSAANGYYVARAGVGVGGTQYRRQTAESPFVAGRIPVHIVKDVTTLSPKIRVVGEDNTDLFDKIETLTTAVTQFQWTLTIEFEGFSRDFRCETADFMVGDAGNFDDLMLRSYQQYVAMEIPCIEVDDVV